MMKILFTLFVLLFSSSVVADDISDFEIEGMSIGDSALDFFSLQEINDNLVETSYANKDYNRYSFYRYSFYKKYDDITIYVKSNDKKYVIQSMSGSIFYEDIKKCLKERDKIFLKMKNLFDKNVTIDDFGEEIHFADESGESKVYSIYFDFKSSAFIRLKCSDISEAMTKKYGWYDNLGIQLISPDFSSWLDNAY